MMSHKNAEEESKHHVSQNAISARTTAFFRPQNNHNNLPVCFNPLLFQHPHNHAGASSKEAQKSQNPLGLLHLYPGCGSGAFSRQGDLSTHGI